LVHGPPHWEGAPTGERVNASWAPQPTEQPFKPAIEAAEATFSRANYALQHKNFNRGEWVELENWVRETGQVKAGRISSFSLPIFGGYMRSVQPARRAPAMIPPGFCKVIAYVDAQTDTLQTRAFLMMQDVDALRDGWEYDPLTKDVKTRTLYNYQRYQVPTTLVEKYTGVLFDPQLKVSNPCLFFQQAGNVVAPEFIEVDAAAELVTGRERTERVRDDEVAVYLAAAMPNPVGADRDHEWVSIANFTGEEVDLSAWTLADAKNRQVKISDVVTAGLKVPAGGSLVVKPLGDVILPNKGGVIILRNADGERVDRVNYHAIDVKPGATLNFFYQRSMVTV